MGFKVPRKTARVQFEGKEFEGCEILLALDLTFEASDHVDALQREVAAVKEAGAEEATAENAPIRRLMDFFADNCIVSWNLEDEEGVALPVTGASFVKFPSWFGLLILNHWKDAVEEASKVPAPLGDSSKNGQSSPEESETMEAASSVPLSSPAPSS